MASSGVRPGSGGEGVRAGAGGTGVAAGGGGGTPTLPLTDIDMWWDASDTTTITATGSNVTLLADKSGRGNDLTPNGVEPVTGTRTVNGLNVLDFKPDITRRTMSRSVPNTNIYTSKAFTLATVVDWDHGLTQNTLFSLCPVTDQDHQGIIIQAAGGGSETVDVVLGDGAGYAGVSDTRTDRYNTSFSVGRAFRLLVIRVDVNGIAVRVDGRTLFGTGAGGTMPLANFLATPAGNIGVGLGRRQHSSGLWAWDARDFGEMLVYSAALTNDQVHDVEAVLAAKWGLSIPATSVEAFNPDLYVPAQSLGMADPLPEYGALAESLPNSEFYVPADALNP